MKQEIDCQVFGDQLDGLIRGELSEEAARLLRLHGATCPDCAALLDVQEHLHSPPLAELEEMVPTELLATIWPGVQARRETRSDRVERGARKRKRGAGRLGGWIPALAAASVILLLSNGFLLARLRESRDREEILAQRLLDQEGDVYPTASPGRESTRPGILVRGGAAGWAAALGERELSVGELRALLESVPGNLTVLTTSQTEALLGTVRLWAPANWRAAAAELRKDGGVRARDLLRVLEALDVPPDRTIPTSRLRDLLS